MKNKATTPTLAENSTDPSILRPQELEAVYAISRAIASVEDTETALNEITRLVRPVFIFDNIVLYEKQTEPALEPTYARAIGRGRFREADLAWGEPIANEAMDSEQTITSVEESSSSPKDRTGTRHFLAIPLTIREQTEGALVFIRFGGPPYTPNQIHLAEFIALHVAQLLGYRQLAEKVADLEARRRLDSLQDDFIALISHELLTPLGFIKGYATTLLREDTSWDEQTRYEFLTIIDDEADRLRELIDNLMDSSRLQAGTLYMNLQPVRLDTLIRDVSLRAKSMFENMVINLEVNTDRIQIQADPTRLAQVFDNLLGNAGKYAPDSPITIKLDSVGDQACIALEDNGPGIPTEHLLKLFQRFYRVPGQSNSIRGTGLGLYICQKIIQAHDGRIWAESTVGNGTTFFIHLPYDREN